MTKRKPSTHRPRKPATMKAKVGKPRPVTYPRSEPGAVTAHEGSYAAQTGMDPVVSAAIISD